MPGQAPSGFIARHWRGEHSLGLAFWGYGIGLSLLVSVVSNIAGASTAFGDLGPRLVGARMLTIYALAVVMSVWQWVGIWRSAANHMKAGGRALWGQLAQVMVVLWVLSAVGRLAQNDGAMLQEGANLMLGIDNVPAYRLRLLGDGAEIELTGGIPFGTADAFKAMLEAHPGIRVAYLDSIGGRIGEALRLQQLIKERQLVTYTARECDSACVIAFLGGRERFLAEGARLGFHASSFGRITDRIVDEWNTQQRRVLKEAGAPQAFIERALRTPPDQLWYPTPGELRAAKLVDAIVDKRFWGLPGFRQWHAGWRLERRLLGLPVISALRQFDPAAYGRFVEGLAAANAAGSGGGDASTRVPAAFQQEILPRYLKTAPDKPLLRYWQLRVDEGRYLAEIDPRSCGELFSPHQRTGVDPRSQLSAELLVEERGALTELIRSAVATPVGPSTNPQVLTDLDVARGRVSSHLAPGQGAPIALETPQRDLEMRCRGVIALYSEVLALPDAGRSAAVLRYLAGI